MRIRLATSIAEVETLRSVWDDALAASPRTIFQDFDWTMLALRTFAEESPCFVTAEADSSVAILPLVAHKGQFTLAGGPLFDYRDAVSAGDDSALAAALECLAELGLPLNVTAVRGRAGAKHWESLAPRDWTGAPFASRKEMGAETFAEKHSRSRRALRRLAELGATVKKSSPTPETLKALYREKAKAAGGWGTNVFHDERCIEFMRVVVGLPSTRCECFVLETADRPVAALVTFVEQEVRRFYTTWMDPAWRKHSPGAALLYEATRLTLEEGLDCDYMTGEQPYKLRFATGSEPLYKVEASAEQLSALRHEETFELKAA